MLLAARVGFGLHLPSQLGELTVEGLPFAAPGDGVAVWDTSPSVFVFADEFAHHLPDLVERVGLVHYGEGESLALADALLDLPLRAALQVRVQKVILICLDILALLRCL